MTASMHLGWQNAGSVEAVPADRQCLQALLAKIWQKLFVASDQSASGARQNPDPLPDAARDQVPSDRADAAERPGHDAAEKHEGTEDVARAAAARAAS